MLWLPLLTECSLSTTLLAKGPRETAGSCPQVAVWLESSSSRSITPTQATLLSAKEF